MRKLIAAVVILAAMAATSSPAGDAKQLYEKLCTKCHGADGKGATKMGRKMDAKDYTDPKVQAALTDEAAIKAIKGGLKAKDGKELMKPTEGISDSDAKALVDYMRTFKQ